MKKWLRMAFASVLASLPLPPSAASAQTLVQTIDLAQPPAAMAVTSIAVDPVSNTVYVADAASTNVFLIDGATNTATAAVLTGPLVSGAQIGVDGIPLGPGYSPNVVLANPVSHAWMWMGQSQGGKYTGTAVDEFIGAKAMRSAGAWDAVTDNLYFADGMEFIAVNNLKLLNWGAVSLANAVAVNSMTGRVYVSSPSLVVFDGTKFTGFRDPAPAPLANVPLGRQPNGLAVNPNTNRIYVAGMTSPTSLDVVDASTYQVLASVPGLPGQSTDFLISGYNGLPLPRPIAINTVTNTIFVLNLVSSTISIVDGKTNTLTGTLAVAVADGAVVSEPLLPGMNLSEIAPSNTFFDSSTFMMTTFGGAAALAVNEATNTLYVASVNGSVSVYALDPPVAPPTYSVNGTIRDTAGATQPGITVTAKGPGGTATAVTDATGLFVLTGLPSGTYTVTPASPAFSFVPQAVSINGQNIGGLAFTANPPIVPGSYTLSPWTLIGPGVVTTGTVTLNQPAPAGGAVVTLSASDSKPAKFPATVTVPAGQSSIAFSVQGNSVSAMTAVTLAAAYNGGVANTVVTVAPTDSLKITKATWSKSSQVLLVTGTSTNALATIAVQNANNNAILGTMVNLGNGSYSFQQTISSSVPTSVNIISNLGGKTGQGVTTIP